MAQPEVTLEQGTLRGYVAKDLKGRNFLKFQGIPYAKPPLGELRFKSPQPPEKWSGILDATKQRDISYSRDLKTGQFVGSEDCLFLNVYTRKLPSSEGETLSPVLVWIHGGGFVWGSGNEEFYGPEFLITENVVLVTINYRLGLLGFLSLEDPALEVPGNAGFKDQVMALKWIQKNISKFGGDPGNVTIFGESAGGMAVHFLMLSPMAKGLFHRVIAQSGCALNAKVRKTPDPKVLASELNLERQDDSSIFEALKEKTLDELQAIQGKIHFLAPAKPKFIGPVVEKNSKDPFLDEEPLELILSGKFSHVPFMIGYNSLEGLIFSTLKKPGEPDVLKTEDYIPWYFGYDYGSPEAQRVVEKLEKFYFGNKGSTEETILKKYELISDSILVHNIHEAVESQYPVSKAPIYFYRLSAETELNFFKKFRKIDLPGVSHLDDVGYLFKNITTPEIKHGSAEDLALRKIVKLWTNFAKFGNPTPDANAFLGVTWKPVTGPNLDFLDIGEELVPLSNPETERVNFWKRLFAESPAGQKSHSK